MFLDLNGRRKDIENIDLLRPNSIFEEVTIQFIKDWLNNKAEFELTTSGSTGVPKPLSIPRNKMEISARATLKALNLSVGGNALVCLSTKFIAGKMMLARALVNKMNIIAVDPSSNPINGLDNTLKFALTAMVPLQMETILEANHPIDGLDNFKVILLGGAPTSLALEKKLKDLTAAIYATYGMTETVSHIALKRLNGVDKSDYFSVLPGVDINLDNRGCLAIRSEITDNQQIVTNDLVQIIDHQKFEWLGRFDNVINSGGVKIQSEKLESLIAELFHHQKIPNRFFCFGVPDEKLGQKVALVIEGTPANVDGMLLNIKNNVPRFHAPKVLYTTPHFVETETKKIQRKLTIEKVISSLPSV